MQQSASNKVAMENGIMNMPIPKSAKARFMMKCLVLVGILLSLTRSWTMITKTLPITMRRNVIIKVPGDSFIIHKLKYY